MCHPVLAESRLLNMFWVFHCIVWFRSFIFRMCVVKKNTRASEVLLKELSWLCKINFMRGSRDGRRGDRCSMETPLCSIIFVTSANAQNFMQHLLCGFIHFSPCHSLILRFISPSKSNLANGILREVADEGCKWKIATQDPNL